MYRRRKLLIQPRQLMRSQEEKNRRGKKKVKKKNRECASNPATLDHSVVSQTTSRDHMVAYSLIPMEVKRRLNFRKHIPKLVESTKQRELKKKKKVKKLSHEFQIRPQHLSRRLHALVTGTFTGRLSSIQNLFLIPPNPSTSP